MDLQQIELLEAEFPRAWAVLQQGLAEGVAPGFVAGVWDIQEPSYAKVAALGNRRMIPSSQPMLPTTAFDLASLTKVMATAPLAALLVERRWIRWDTPLRALLPEYPFRRIELRHLLSHTAGLPAWAPFWEKLRVQFAPRPLYKISIAERQLAMKKQVLAIVPESFPGERVLYSDITFLLLGFVLEQVLQMPLDHAVKSLLWDPMGLGGAFFSRTDRDVQAGVKEFVAATEDCPWRGGVLQGQVHDDNAWAMGGYGGHAGAFGSALDVLQFVARSFGGFFSNEIMHALWSRVNEPKGCERTLGWDTPSAEASSSGKYFSSLSVGHLGFTGTSLWVDTQAGLAVTLLSNRVHPSRESIKIRMLRPRFHDAVREDLWA